jgi:natural product precursor
MVTKKAKKGRVKVSKLKLNKETVKSLGDKEAKKVKGGQKAQISGVACIGSGNTSCCTW